MSLNLQAHDAGKHGALPVPSDAATGLADLGAMGISFTAVVTGNRGFACINRLQMGTGGAEVNNMLDRAIHASRSAIDVVKHPEGMGAGSVKVGSFAELEEALAKRVSIEGPYVIVIDTDPYPSTAFGGSWWDVAVPEDSDRREVAQMRAAHVENKKTQRAN